MGTELVKGLIKIGSAIVAIGFGTKVAKEGKKNLDNWNSQNKISNK